MLNTILPEEPPARVAPGLTPPPAPPAGRVAMANLLGLLGLPLLAYVVTILRGPFDAVTAVSLLLAGTAYLAGAVVARALWQRLLHVEQVEHPLRRHAERMQDWCVRSYAGCGEWCERRPLATLWLVALAGVLLSCYPVVFLGKSFVGPAICGNLLYDRLPTLPGSTETHLEWTNGADTAAGMLASLPYAAVERRSLFQDGEFPLWNRYNAAGVPLLGQGQSMVGDPLNLLVILAGGNGWAWDGKFLLAKLLFAAGIGLAVRRANGGRIFAAVTLTFGACFLGFFPYRFNHPSYFSVCYAPWILLAWFNLGKSEVGSRRSGVRRLEEKACRTMTGAHCQFPVRKRIEVVSPSVFRLPTSALALLLLADWMELCSGTAKEACFLLIVLNGAGAGALLLSGALPWRQRWTRLALAAWASGCLLLLSAPLWLTFLDALRDAWTAYTEPGALQIQPGMLAGLFDDIFYRQYNHTAAVYSPTTNFLVLLGVGLALVGWRSLAQRGVYVALTACTLGTAALVFGVVPPAAIAAIPLLGNVIHVDTTFSCPLIVLLVVLAGGGLQHARDRLGARGWSLDIWGAVFVLGLVVALFLGMAQATQNTDFAPMPLEKINGRAPFFWGYVATLVAAFAALPFLWRRFCLDRGASAPGVLPWVVLCLTALLWRQGLHSHAVAGPGLYVVYPPARADFHAKSRAVERLLTLQRARPGRCSGFNGNLTPGFGAALGLEMTSGPDALQNRYVHQLLIDSQVPVQYAWSMGVNRQDVASLRRRFYDLLNLRYYLDLPPGTGQPPEPVPPAMHLLGHDDLDVYESESAWPRAFFTDALARCNDDRALLTLLNLGDGRPFAAVSGDDMAAQPELGALTGHRPTERAIVPATDYHLTANTTEFRVHATSPGVVAVMEGFQARDMRVSVNGQPAPCLRIDQGFSGVYLARAGDYTVRFHYWPRLLTPSLWLAALGAGLLGATAWGLRRVANSPSPSHGVTC